MEGEATGAQATVLVVDDEPLTRELITRFLKREGIASDVAASGREALQMLQQHGYDVVLTDIQMPDISGIELYRRAKAFSPETAFIMVTGFSDTDTAVQALKLGAFDYLLKPLNLDELGLSVRKALEKRRMERELQLYREALENKVVRRTEELIDRSRQLRRLLLSTIQTLIFTLWKPRTSTPKATRAGWRKFPLFWRRSLDCLLRRCGESSWPDFFMTLARWVFTNNSSCCRGSSRKRSSRKFEF
ncbi:MAG: sigma-54-dependent Fis family transcriptional regulator, partial [Calditrichaeota bacterium]|nr:sigma-54-dependent Fis family transcriptional regulator [Calditrichota bacterium]